MRSVGYRDVRDDSGLTARERERSARNPFGTSANPAAVET
jgi:hypothetical protein